MGTTIVPATFRVTVNEEVTIGGITHDVTSSFVKTGVTCG